MILNYSLTNCPNCNQEATEIESITGYCLACVDELTKRKINKIAREQDESNLFPINNQFNATERAIRKIRKQDINRAGLEYALALDQEISDIVNNQI